MITFIFTAYEIYVDELYDNFIDALRARLAVAELDATFLSGFVGDVSIPKCTGSATAYLFGADTRTQ